MDSFIDLLRSRRSIRQYSDEPVESEEIDVLIESVLRSPSSRSLNPWEFVVVNDEETLQNLSKAKPHGAAFLKNAPLAIVVCADPAKCDVWVEDSSIAATLIHLSATDLGLGSCWIQIRLREHDENSSAEDFVKEKLGLPDHMVVEAIVAIGYPKEEKAGHSEDDLLWDRISYNKYGVKQP